MSSTTNSSEENTVVEEPNRDPGDKIPSTETAQLTTEFKGLSEALLPFKQYERWVVWGTGSGTQKIPRTPKRNRRARNLALLSPMKGYVPQQVNVERRFSSSTNS